MRYLSRIKRMIIGLVAMMTAVANRAAVPTEPADNGEIRVLVFSDPHVLAPTLFDADGTAWRRWSERDMRVTEASAALLDSVINRAITLRPDVVLVTGDLTKDGERESHEFVASRLRRLTNAGIPTLVIPGNHDISNPYATAYHDDTTVPTETITRNEFADIYADFGYGAATHRDTASLAYCCEPIAGLTVLALDSNRDRENLLITRGDSINSYHNAGTITEASLEWAEKQAREATKRGNKIIAMCHHHIVPHSPHEATALPNYIINNADEVCERLYNAGVKTIFTGHLHIANLSSKGYGDEGDRVNELASGALSTYPFIFNLVALNSGDIASSQTIQIGNIHEEGRRRVENAVPSLTAMVTSRAWSLLDSHRDKLSAMMRMVTNHEVPLPATRSELNELVSRYFCGPLRSTVLAITEARLPGFDATTKLNNLDHLWREATNNLLNDYFHDEAVTEFFITNVFPKIMDELRPLIVQ